MRRSPPPPPTACARVQELSSPTVLPVFLSHEALATTWTAAGHAEPPPTRLSILDLRMLANEMLAPFA